MSAGIRLTDASATASLPKTTEGAVSRYVDIYHDRFVGSASEMVRLSKYVQVKTLLLRKRAPNFYETQLPKLVNQAASKLLTLNTNTPADQATFHETHRYLLRILDELIKSQPKGEVNFQVEIDRAKKKNSLMQQQLHIRRELSQLNAMEFDFNDLGEEDPNSNYMKIFRDIERKRAELRRVSMLILKLEGQELNEQVELELKIFKGCLVLHRLSPEVRDQLEAMIVEFLQADPKKNRERLFVERSNIEQMIAKLKLSEEEFPPNDIEMLVKDVIESCRIYFREAANERRNEYFDSLLSDQYLKPKEGLLLSDPDDVPEETKEKFNRNARNSKIRLEEICEEFDARAPLVEGNFEGEQIDEDDAINDGDVIFVEEFIKENSHIFVDRVKEEPRDDYEHNGDSDDEVVVSDDSAADQIELVMRANREGEANEQDEVHPLVYSDEEDYEDEDGYADDEEDEVKDDEKVDNSANPPADVKAEDAQNVASTSSGMYQTPQEGSIKDEDKKFLNGNKMMINLPPQKRPKLEEKFKPKAEEGELEFMGVVEPVDKIPEVITID